MEEYLARVRHVLPAEEWVLKPATFRGSVEAVRKDEGARLLERLKAGDVFYVLDERGQALGTEAWRDLVQGAMNGGARRVVFALGGPYGHGDEVRQRAARMLSLSPLVLNHQVARVVVAEQLYRVVSLMRGEPYHH